MPSRRKLKKRLKAEYYDIMEDSLSYSLYNPGKKDSEANAIVDDAADEIHRQMSGIREHYKVDHGSRRAHFKTLANDARDKAMELRRRVDDLYR